MKRSCDLLLSLLLLFPLVPGFLLIGLWIRYNSPGPIFYRGTRIGRFRRPFRIFKFRTMVLNAERIGGSSTADDDPRITSVGRILRKHKLDELPQVLNVLRGEMSLVGPRPEVPAYVKMYTQEQMAILTVRPGVTDWASLWNLDEGARLAGAADPDKAYMEEIRPEKLRLQLEYVACRSFWVDVKILARTVQSVLAGIRRKVSHG